jgi:hypothetical protein
MLCISLSVLLTPLSSSAAKGGEKGPADQAWERANDKARFKRDEAGYGDMGEYQGKKQKDKDKDKYKSKDKEKYKDEDRDRDNDDDRDRDRYDDDRGRDDAKAKQKAKDKGSSAGDMEVTEPGEQKRGRFWDRMKFWERQPAE